MVFVGFVSLQLKRSLQYVFCCQGTHGVHGCGARVSGECVCERARGKTDLRTICPAATSDGHRVVLRRREPPCTHTHTHTHTITRVDGRAENVREVRVDFGLKRAINLICRPRENSVCIHRCV